MVCMHYAFESVRGCGVCSGVYINLRTFILFTYALCTHSRGEAATNAALRGLRVGACGWEV